MTRYEPAEPTRRDLAVLAALGARNGVLTEVELTDGRRIRVWNIAWGYDAGEPWAHISTNISPPVSAAQLDVFATHEVTALREPGSGELLIPPPP